MKKRPPMPKWDEELFEGWIEFWYFLMPQHPTWRMWVH